MSSKTELDSLLTILRRGLSEGTEHPAAWRHVVRLARQLEIAPLLYHGLRNLPESGVDGESFAELEKAYTGCASSNILRLGQLEEVLEAFRLAGIPTIVLKGAALAQTVYPNICCRPMRDLDILVPPERVREASTALQGMGYVFHLDKTGHDQRFRETFDGELLFFRRTGKIPWGVDLHWHVVSAFPWLRNLWAVDMGRLWERARPISFGQQPALQLSPEDTLFHLCIHTAAHHNYRGILPYCDIDRVIRAHDIDWEQVVCEAAATRTRVAVYFALSFLKEFLGTEIPAQVSDRLRPPAWQRRVSARHRPQLSRDPALRVGEKEQILFHLLLADGPGSAAKVLGQALLPDGDWLASRYNEWGMKLVWRRVRHFAKIAGYAVSASREFLSGS